MKTAVSIPEKVFRQAERLARRLRKSRSEIYSLALAEYLNRHDADHVTEAIDRLMAEIGTETDQFIASASRRVLERSEW
jgi:metal-responsive CopG/Arc/MetJ family transcriptional regulator